MHFHSNARAAACAVACALAFAMGAALAATDANAAGDDPFRAAEAWVFPKSHSPDPSVPKQAQAPKRDRNKPLHVPGSTRTYTLAQTDTDFEVADWFPQDHPPMPHIVTSGRKPAWACAACHKPGGEGFPSTASLAGLSKVYLREQLQAFRGGQRDNHVMTKEARNLDAADGQAAVRYFSGLKIKSHERVVETTSVPRTHWDDYVLEPDHDAVRESLGERIIEVQPRDDNSSERTIYTAYVPRGSITAGAKIAARGVGAAPSCESCHGANLQGVGDIPYLAGRSPTYLVRELILFRLGRRTNPGAAPMRAEVSHLTLKDMIDVAAYAASLRD